MASSEPLFERPRDSIDSADADEETSLLYGLASRSRRRPFRTSFCPTLYTRGIALVLALAAFIIFVVHGPQYAPPIVFLSFAIARQVFVLGSFWGSMVVVIRIEVVHPGLRAAHARAQERWVKRIAGLVCDGVVLMGLLIALAVNARDIAVCRFGCPPTVTRAEILAFVAFGLLLLSVPDCGMPHLVTRVWAIEKPTAGVWRFTSSVQFGEPEDEEESTGVRDIVPGGSGQNNGKGPSERYMESV